MASITEIDSRMKYECEEFKELLKYMRECYDKMNDGDSDAVYEKDVIIGFGNRIAHAKGGAATYTALEYAITYILEQEYEYEEEEETPPVGKLVKSYEIVYTGGEIWCVYGWMNNGMWFCGTTPDDGTSIMLYSLTDEQKKYLKDEWADAVNEITCDDPTKEYLPNDAKWLLAWTEILDDYAKNGEHSAELEHWRYEMLEEVAK